MGIRVSPSPDAVGIPVREFCSRFGVSTSSAYELIAAGELEAVRLGRKVIIITESAERWFRSLPRYEAS